MIAIKPMDEEFLLPKCLHDGPIDAAAFEPHAETDSSTLPSHPWTDDTIRALGENADEGIPLPDRLLVAGPGEVDDPGALLIGKCAQQADSDHPWLPGCPPPLPTVKEFLARHSPDPS